MNKIQIVAAGVFALCAASPAFSQTTTNVPIGVSLVLGGTCVANTPGLVSIGFGEILNPAGQATNLDADTGGGPGPGLSLTCNQNSVTATVKINGGSNAFGGVRRLQNPGAAGTSGQYVFYHLYDSPGRAPASEYLIATPRSFNGGVVTAGTDLNFAVYARIIANDVRLAVGGSYDDSVQLTLTL